jgi:hypothetical protein
MKAGDIVVVDDWSYSISCNASRYGNIKYLPMIPSRYIGIDTFEIIEIGKKGDYPSESRKVSKLNDTMIESTLTKEIFYTQLRFLSPAKNFKPFLNDQEFSI